MIRRSRSGTPVVDVVEPDRTPRRSRCADLRDTGRGRPRDGNCFHSVDVESDLGEVVGDHLPVEISTIAGTVMRGVVGEAGEVGVLQSGDPQHGIDTARIEVERPAPLVVRGTADAHGQNIFQAQQAADDDRAIGHGHRGPRSTVPPGLYGIAVPAVGGDPGGDVAGVAREFLAGSTKSAPAPVSDVLSVSVVPVATHRASAPCVGPSHTVLGCDRDRQVGRVLVAQRAASRRGRDVVAGGAPLRDQAGTTPSMPADPQSGAPTATKFASGGWRPGWATKNSDPPVDRGHPSTVVRRTDQRS